MTAYRDLPYHQTCWKATHNSYAKGADLAAQLAHDPTRPHDNGARGLELDLYHDKLALEFWVCHNPPVLERREKPLSQHLAELAAWSDAGDHDPITVTLDIKQMRGSPEHWPGVLDRYLLRHLDGDRIFRPGHFWTRGATSLVQAVHEQGWPTIGELRGKILFVLSGTETRKQQYAAQAFDRVCFADRKMDLFPLRPATTTGNRIFLNYNLAELSLYDEECDEIGWDLATLDDRFGYVARDTLFVTRGYGLNNRKGWELAGRLGVNARATDALTGQDWALAGETPFAERRFTGAGRRSRSGTG